MMMQPVRPWVLGVNLLVATGVGWGASSLVVQAGGPTLGLPYTALITLGIVVFCVFGLGWRVRAWRMGNRRRPLNPILAARTLLLAQACAYAGALLCGWHVGVLLAVLNSSLVNMGAVLWPAVALVVGSLVVVAVGLIVERFCRVPPEEMGPSGVEMDGDGDYAV